MSTNDERISGVRRGPPAHKLKAGSRIPNALQNPVPDQQHYSRGLGQYSQQSLGSLSHQPNVDHALAHFSPYPVSTVAQSFPTQYSKDLNGSSFVDSNYDQSFSFDEPFTPGSSGTDYWSSIGSINFDDDQTLPMTALTSSPEPPAPVYPLANHASYQGQGFLPLQQPSNATNVANNNHLDHSSHSAAQIMTWHEKSVLLGWIRVCHTNSVNPVNENEKIRALATALNIDPLDVMKFVVANINVLPSDSIEHETSEQLPTGQALNCAAKSSRGKDTYDRRRSLADEYVKKKQDTQCNPNPAQSSPGGIYLCPWQPCPFAHHSHNDWKKHLENRQPQQVYVCYRCFESDHTSKRKEPSIEHRKDKHVNHLLKAHGVTATESDLRLSYFKISGNFLDRCNYALSAGGRSCEEPFISWEEQLKHLAIHCQTEANDQEPDSRSTRSKRPSNAPQTGAQRKKRGTTGRDP